VIGTVDHGLTEDRVFPIQVDLDELVQVPVDANIDKRGLVGPKFGVAKSARKYLPADRQLAESSRWFKCAQAESAGSNVERVNGIDYACLGTRFACDKIGG
jgi:hypothetical protein